MSTAPSGAFNRSSGNQKTGGSLDDTPGQVESAPSAKVSLAYPHRIDSMGGSEDRDRDNNKRG